MLGVQQNQGSARHASHPRRRSFQVWWLIDGVPVPNASIASNVGVKFDHKDIAYLKVQGGSYSAEYGNLPHHAASPKEFR